MKEFVKRHDRLHRILHATYCRVLKGRVGSTAGNRGGGLTLTVTVVNPSNLFLVGASVSMAGVNQTTGSNGQAVLSGLAAGTYTLQITLSGYQGVSQTFTVVGNSSLNITLLPIVTGASSPFAGAL